MRYRILVSAVLLTLLGACGDPEEPAPAPPSRDDWALSYAQCMREHGIDMPDPKPGEGFAMPMGGPGQDATVEASRACRDRVGDPPAAEGGQLSDEELTDRQLKLVQCLREHGVDVPDPQPGQGMAFDLSWPAEAMEACGLPRPPAGGGE